MGGSFLTKAYEKVVYVCTDIKSLTEDDDPTLVEKARAAFRRYSEEQLTAVKVPGGGGGGGGKTVSQILLLYVYYLGLQGKG